MGSGSSNSRGVAILIKKGVDYTSTPHSKIIDPLGRYIILKAEIKDKIYVLISIHAPNKDKDSFKFFTDFFTVLIDLIWFIWYTVSPISRAPVLS